MVNVKFLRNATDWLKPGVVFHLLCLAVYFTYADSSFNSTTHI